MKKQIAIAIATVAIMLMAVLIVPPVMAFAVRDGNSVQYSYHRVYNPITDNSVTAPNQQITIGNGIGARESSSRVKYYGAPVPVITANQAIVMGTGIRAVRGISWYSVNGIGMNITEKFANEIIDESDGSVVEGEAPPPIKLETSGLLKNATLLHVYN